ncbi:hypothetical protein [Citricoccus nitrophenolicus]|uniref:hypothetical protein n=1 Tax=Citricoccus nitrophenolicus TaxID=863575 RepID=UPI0031EDA8B8
MVITVGKDNVAPHCGLRTPDRFMAWLSTFIVFLLVVGGVLSGMLLTGGAAKADAGSVYYQLADTRSSAKPGYDANLNKIAQARANTVAGRDVLRVADLADVTKSMKEPGYLTGRTAAGSHSFGDESAATDGLIRDHGSIVRNNAYNRVGVGVAYASSGTVYVVAAYATYKAPAKTNPKPVTNPQPGTGSSGGSSSSSGSNSGSSSNSTPSPKPTLTKAQRDARDKEAAEKKAKDEAAAAKAKADAEAKAKAEAEAKKKAEAEAKAAEEKRQAELDAAAKKAEEAQEAREQAERDRAALEAEAEAKKQIDAWRSEGAESVQVTQRAITKDGVNTVSIAFGGSAVLVFLAGLAVGRRKPLVSVPTDSDFQRLHGRSKPQTPVLSNSVFLASRDGGTE